MREYNPDLITTLQADQRQMIVEGQPIQIKRVPDESRAGYPDPRFLASMLEQARQMEGQPAIDFAQLTVDQMRQFMGSPNRNLNTIELVTRFETLDFGCNQVGLWIYTPRKPFGKKDRPVMIFFHGGGFIGGSPFAVENDCRLLAELADAVVVNVDYSLAPEKPFPNGLNDCYNVVCHIHDHAADYGIDPARIAVGGDSAGGNLAAACILKAHALGRDLIRYQALIYPAVLLGSEPFPGFNWRIEDFEMASEYRSLLEPVVRGFQPHEGEEAPFDAMYVQDVQDFASPLVSPLRAPDLTVFPKTLVATAEYDGLRVMGELFGRRLQAAGVPTRVIRYNGVGHAFIDSIGLLPQAEDLMLEIARDLKAL
jgi:acetyl esterase